MTAADARAWIEQHTNASGYPGLTSEELDGLVERAVLGDAWTADKVYLAGDAIVVGEVVWEALYGGTSGTVEPTWSGDEVSDGTVTWTPYGATRYDLYGGAAEGWELIAAKLADRFDSSLEGASWRRSQMYDHAVKQAERYAARSVRHGKGNLGSIRLAAPDRTIAVRREDSWLTRQ